MPGPVTVDPQRKQSRMFRRETAEDTQVLLGIMRILHAEPLSGAFARILKNSSPGDEALPLAHFFEEVSVLSERGHVAEDLVFDVFALDLYWDQLAPAVRAARKSTGNNKLCEHFETMAEVAREYRESRPARVG
ncbi:MAG: DUF4760 domain-containing protein [Candidatus Dormibacteria bacterium]